MDKQTLSAEVREGRGKGPARQLRAAGKIPAVFYGPGVETQALAVSPKELVKALSTDWGRNTVLELAVGSKKELVMVKDIQVHPVGRHPMHVDLYRVTTESQVEVRVPFGTTGRALGVQKGGALTVVFRDLPIRTTPTRIPSKIEVDVSHLDMGDAFEVSDLSLPEGVKVLFKPDRRLCLVGEDKRKAQAEAEAAAEAAAAEAKAAAAATPGATPGATPDAAAKPETKK